MNFFDAQDRARRASKWLVVLYFVATALIVVGVTLVVAFAMQTATTANYAEGNVWQDNRSVLVATAVVTTLFIFGASLFKTAALSSGGGSVATAMGGTLVDADTRDPLRRRLRNVVEEMAIASGVPVPEIYVLEAESGINAFAAGYAPGDAAVAVTRGALEILDRDELQGVIAHEFSHILNGDMRLNIRLMGVLFGILALGLVGRTILRGGYHSSIVSKSRDRSTPVIVVVGIGLAVLGFIGVFFARIIKAGVSRQREYLADSSAVQFTRQTNGIANALKKIGGYSESSHLTATDPEQISHMLFGSGSKLFGMFATHPPLTDRIKALDPSFDPSDYPKVDAMQRSAMAAGITSDGRAAGLAAAFAEGGATVSPESIADTVGSPDIEHVHYAERIRRSLPDTLYDAAHSSEHALLLVVALILEEDEQVLTRQMNLLEERLGADRTRIVREYFDLLASTDREFRLPLLEVSFPALKLRPEPQLSFLIDLAHRLIQIDDETKIYEYSFYRILTSNLGQAIDPAGGRTGKRASRKEVRMAAVNLLALVADHGHDDPRERDAAYKAGAAILGDWATRFEVQPKRDYSVDILDHSLDVVLRLNGKSRRRLLRALAEVAAHDGVLRIREAELLRVVCAALNLPLPPILVRENQPD